MSMRNYTIGLIGAVLIAVPGLVAMGGEAVKSRDEKALEKAISELYHGCMESDGAHVYDVFIKAATEIEECATRIYEQKMRVHGGIAGWQFEDADIQKIYENACSDIDWMYNRVPRYSEDEIRKQFVNHFIYAMNDRLIEKFLEAIWDSPSVSVEDVELHLTGNEKKITLEYHQDTGKTTVRYERDGRKRALPERIVKIESLFGRVPLGATPYFQIPKEADVVSCWVQQTGDHLFLWQVQNMYHCCAHTSVDMKDGTRESYKFWRDGQEMEYSSDKLLPQQDASKFIKVFFTVKEDEGRPSPRAGSAEEYLGGHGKMRTLPGNDIDEQAGAYVEIDIDGNHYTYQEFYNVLREICVEHPELEIIAIYQGERVNISHNNMWDIWPVTVPKDEENTTAGPYINVIEKKDATLVVYRILNEDSPDESMRNELTEILREKKREKLVFLISAPDGVSFSAVMAHIRYLTQHVPYDGILFGRDIEKARGLGAYYIDSLIELE